MKVMLVGAGGREHALALALAADPSVSAIIAVPGNPGIAEVARAHCINGDILDSSWVVHTALTEEVNIVVVGPEPVMATGICDDLRAAGIAVIGAGTEAARLESSRQFAKEIMAALDIPTPMSRACETLEEVEDAIGIFPAPYVIKDNGLSAGTGVLLTNNHDAALEYARQAIIKNAGVEGAGVVVEEFIAGQEFSLTYLCDGRNVIPLIPVRNYKRLVGKRKARNTGGMGAYAPLRVDHALIEEVTERVAKPVVREMARQGSELIGPLTLTLIAGERGIRVLEFDVHFGDPETQVVLPLLRNPLGELLSDVVNRRLDTIRLDWTGQTALGVVLTLEGYPGPVRTGDPVKKIKKAQQAHNVSIIHAGTAADARGALVSDSGRVLTVVAVSDTRESARKDAYHALNVVKLDNSFYRDDIGKE